LSNYPAWRFNAEGQSVIVHSEADDAALGDAWGTTVPEAFDPKLHPTFKAVEHVPTPIDVEAIAEEVAAPERRKPGRPKKAE